MRTLSPTLARRLAITRQHLAGPRATPDADGIFEVVRDLGCLQLDPISAVARSHRLVLWSRVGNYDPDHLDTLLWKERKLFEYWAHQASIVLTEDYPVHHLMMRTYASGTSESAQAGKFYQWLKDNAGLRRHILAELRRNGPLPSRVFQDKSEADWHSTGWTAGRNVSQMLDYLWIKGQIMVAGRSGLQKLWDLSERCLPDWTPREKLIEREVVYRAAQKSLRALGVAVPRHIQRHYIRGRYPQLQDALQRLAADGCIEEVAVEGLPGPWYIHTDVLPLIEQLSNGAWAPRTTLLSPFDNLIYDRARTQLLFNFDFTMEIYVPPAKRQYGYYVLPILYGDRLIGRLDPKLDRARGVLTINAVYAEPDAPTTRTTARAVAQAIQALALFLGAKDIAYNRRRVPAAWKRDLLA
ncbi:MAG TPA: crosslink repair DNA glycosylase YcaQ family protein [Anaerolineae bacterium]|nr:crosslink repair DNA glycosylase YcaQ family protein [Anaerolineae bacterium]